MIKKILLVIILLSIIVSCGKKGDPVFKESNHFKFDKIKII